jgi:aminoglycoside/choline kinase family phosphotransferase
MNRRPDNAQVKATIGEYLARTSWDARGARVVPLTGDASDRSYFRVLTPADGSFVLAVHASPFTYRALPFVNVAELLDEMPVPIPEILGHDEGLGVLALEDLGDVTLQAHLGASSVAEHAALYREAVGLIATLQRRGAELADPRYLPYGIAFDVAKLTWELDYFVRHFVQGYRGACLSPAVSEALAEEWRRLAEELASEARVLCHRDYHSRNLMWHRDRLYMIDFQDARMGPDTYDLVSLLRDSYVDLAEHEVEALVAYFLATRAARPDGRAFRQRFDTMALQRNLKALGTFGYQTSALGNPVYIQYIPRTLRYARNNLSRHQRFGRLHEILAGLVDELR